MYEQAAAAMEREPRNPLDTEQIAAAAVASKSGAGIWLLSHAKEILIGAVSFAVGVGATLLVTHALQDEAPSQLPAEQTALVTADSSSGETLSADTAVYTAESYMQAVVEPENQTSTASSSSIASSPKQKTVTTATSTATEASTKSEPVVVKKTVIQRDTVQIHETVIVRDTIVIN